MQIKKVPECETINLLCLTLSIADTIRQYIAITLKLFVHGRNMANSTAMIVEQWLDRLKTDLHDLYFDSLMFPRFHCTAGPSQLHCKKLEVNLTQKRSSQLQFGFIIQLLPQLQDLYHLPLLPQCRVTVFVYSKFQYGMNTCIKAHKYCPKVNQ